MELHRSDTLEDLIISGKAIGQAVGIANPPVSYIGNNQAKVTETTDAGAK